MSTIVLVMRTKARALGDLLFGQTRSRILALLYGIPDRSFYVREIARQIDTSVGTVQRELKALSDVGLIDRSMRGKQVFYQVNKKHPVFEEMRSMIAKTTGVFDLLRSALGTLAKHISIAFVYGSIARGDDNAESDVDLMVVGSVTLDDLLKQLTPVERGLGRTINPSVYPLNQFRTRLQEGNHFLNSVLRGKKVFLIGEEDELRKVGGIRMAKS
jgi:predicted nucleotidyltransferase